MSIEKIVIAYAAMGAFTAFVTLNMSAVRDIRDRKRRYKLDDDDIVGVLFSFILWPIALPIMGIVVLQTEMEEICSKHDWHPFEWFFLWPLRVLDIIADRRGKSKEEPR